jgi:hypothetical protein
MVKFIETESTMVVAWPGGREEESEELEFNGCKVSVWEKDKILKMASGNG